MFYLYIYLAMLVGALCTFIAVTAMRRGETHNVGKFGWLFLILLSPPVGLIFFLWLGGKKISAEHCSRDLIKLPTCGCESKVVDCLAEIAVTRGLQKVCDRNRVILVDSPEQTYEQVFDLIDSAEHSLFIQTFILSDDAFGNKLIDRLCEKAASGVIVRLMVDGFGSFLFPQDKLEKLDRGGAKAMRFKPMGQLSQFAYLNFRNHRKMMIADGKRALLGGANLVEYEIDQTPSEETWIDLSLRIDGCIARQIETVFISDWKFATDESLEPSTVVESTFSRPQDNQADVQLVPIGPDGPSEIIDDLWMTAISRAEESVWITSPYFVPPPLAMRSLTMAVRRGIDVRIIVPERSDLRAADYARIDFFRDLDQIGAKIFRHPSRVVHAKTVIIDQRVAYAGSANFDMRSFFLNYELMVGIFNKETVGSIREWFQQLSQQCEPGIASQSIKRRFLGTVSRMVAEEL